MARTTFTHKTTTKQPSKVRVVQAADAKPTTAKAKRMTAKQVAEHNRKANEAKREKPTGLPTIAADADPKTWPDGFHPCGCGCGAPTKRLFRQGHDAKVHSLLVKVHRGETKVSAEQRKAPIFAKANTEALKRMSDHAKARAAA